MFCNIFIWSKQIRIQTTEKTSTILILNVFNFWFMRMKTMHLCMIWIKNWNMKDIIFWNLFIKDIWSIQLIIENLLFCHEIRLNPVIINSKPFFYLAVWPLDVNLFIFRFESDCFPLVIYFCCWLLVFLFSYIFWVLLWMNSVLLQPIIF